MGNRFDVSDTWSLSQIEAETRTRTNLTRKSGTSSTLTTTNLHTSGPTSRAATSNFFSSPARKPMSLLPRFLQPRAPAPHNQPGLQRTQVGQAILRMRLLHQAPLEPRLQTTIPQARQLKRRRKTSSWRFTTRGSRLS